jgi:hypothetical protein
MQIYGGEGAHRAASVRDSQINKMSKIDAFADGRATKPRHYWDSLSMREFADYLSSGISAAREGCEDRARIFNLDWANPFPILLGWPSSGGTTYLASGYIVSEKSHLPNDVMFREVNCIMIPKLPAIMAERDFLPRVHGPFLSNSFEQLYESGPVDGFEAPLVTRWRTTAFVIPVPRLQYPEVRRGVGSEYGGSGRPRALVCDGPS